MISCQLLFSYCLFHLLLMFWGCLSDTEIFPHQALLKGQVEVFRMNGNVSIIRSPWIPWWVSETGISCYIYGIQHTKCKSWLVQQWVQVSNWQIPTRVVSWLLICGALSIWAHHLNSLGGRVFPCCLYVLDTQGLHFIYLWLKKSSGSYSWKPREFTVSAEDLKSGCGSVYKPSCWSLHLPQIFPELRGERKGNGIF